MSVCRVRLILWLLLTGISVIGGIVTDFVLHSSPFPVWLRLIGLAGIVLFHFPLKRTGKLLSRYGESVEWGCTNRLIVTDLYRCLRHPHHFFIGLFMVCLGLAIGHMWSLILVGATQWLWILGFLFLVEERELLQKFGEPYAVYRRRVPMLISNPVCIIQILSSSMEGPG
jgi:protein-S-isoprenylcysteine O-methyltransferase Ste14